MPSYLKVLFWQVTLADHKNNATTSKVLITSIRYNFSLESEIRTTFEVKSFKEQSPEILYLVCVSVSVFSKKQLR